MVVTSRRSVVRYLAVAAAVVMVSAGGAWLLRDAGPSETTVDSTVDTTDPVWEVVPEAFPPSGHRAGPYLIAPSSSGCFVAFGNINTGTVTTAGYWRSTDDCQAGIDVGPTRRPSTVAPLADFNRGSIIAAVPAHDGGFLLVHRYTYEGDAFAYESSVLRSDPDAGSSLQQLAEFRSQTPRESHVGPSSLVATDTGYVAAGREDDVILAWTSPDGARWEPVPLPTDGLGEYPRVSALAVAADGRLVAVGTGGTSGFSDRPAGWVSTDGGASWRQARMPDGGKRPQFAAVVHDGHEFVALGVQDGDVRSAALVMTSPDGAEWTRDDSLAGAGGASVNAATVLPDGRVLAVSYADEAGSDPGDCAVAWRRSAAGWVDEPLGCNGVPTSLAVLADGSVAGVDRTTLFLRR